MWIQTPFACLIHVLIGAIMKVRNTVLVEIEQRLIKIISGPGHLTKPQVSLGEAVLEAILGIRPNIRT